MLDNRFFRLVTPPAAIPPPPPPPSTEVNSGSDNNVVLEAYKAVYARSTMVLFSRKTHTPIAALTFQGNADDMGCLAMLTARPSVGPDPNDNNNNNNNNNTWTTRTPPHLFQGMLSLPDQPFSFTITNLSHEGVMQFDIRHAPDYNNVVSSSSMTIAADPNPNFSINYKFSTLQPNQSYTIEADQRTQRRMILAGKTKRDASTGKSTAVTVRESELETEENNKGLYFSLNVVADQACPWLVQKFQEGTVWKVVFGFIRRIPIKQPPPNLLLQPGRTSAQLAGGRRADGSSSKVRLFRIFGTWRRPRNTSAADESSETPPSPSSLTKRERHRTKFASNSDEPRPSPQQQQPPSQPTWSPFRRFGRHRSRPTYQGYKNKTVVMQEKLQGLSLGEVKHLDGGKVVVDDDDGDKLDQKDSDTNNNKKKKETTTTTTTKTIEYNVSSDDNNKKETTTEYYDVSSDDKKGKVDYNVSSEDEEEEAEGTGFEEEEDEDEEEADDDGSVSKDDDDDDESVSDDSGEGVKEVVDDEDEEDYEGEVADIDEEAEGAADGQDSYNSDHLKDDDEESAKNDDDEEEDDESDASADSKKDENDFDMDAPLWPPQIMVEDSDVPPPYWSEVNAPMPTPTPLWPEMGSAGPVSSAPPPFLAPPPAASTKFHPGVAPIDIGGTQAGELRYGGGTVDAAPVPIMDADAAGRDYEYDYDHPSEPTVLCLSIWQDMKFLPLADIEKALLDQVHFFMEHPHVYHQMQEILKVYKTDHCVIDLESEADTVICSCGHQCLHHANISATLLECPLCRSTITAFLPAHGLLMMKMNAIISGY